MRGSRNDLSNILSFAVTGPDAISIFAVGGLRGQRGVDYQIINNERLTWEGYAYGSKLQAGDQITLTYMDFSL